MEEDSLIFPKSKKLKVDNSLQTHFVNDATAAFTGNKISYFILFLLFSFPSYSFFRI